MSKRFTTLDSEVLSENPWWVYRHDRYVLPSGAEGDYFYMETPGSVMIVPVLADGRIVMVNQFRYLHDKWSLEFPSGGVKPGQSIEQTAHDELQEETGYQAREMINVGIFETSPGLMKDAAHLFVAYVHSQGEQSLDETEQIELRYRRPDEIHDMIIQGDLWDGMSIATWAMVSSRLR